VIVNGMGIILVSRRNPGNMYYMDDESVPEQQQMVESE